MEMTTTNMITTKRYCACSGSWCEFANMQGFCTLTACCKQMSAYDQVYKAYTDSQKNGFWDAWGIVASPKFVHELKVECMERMVVHNTDAGALEKIFGLVVIPHALLSDKDCYVVDEQLGRTILGQMERSE